MRTLLSNVLISLIMVSFSQAQVSSRFFGMSDYIHRPKQSNWEPWPSVPFGHLRSFDTYTEWWKLETSRGVYNWSNLDWLVGLSERHKIDLLYTFAMVPRWASSDPNNTGCHLAKFGAYGSCAPPANIRYWDEFVHAVATRYAGRIHYYELWNEPNITEYWTGTPAQMVIMAQHAYQIIKSIDPTAKVVSPSTLSGYGASWMGWYLAAGGGHYADVIAFHGYQPQKDVRVAELIASYVDLYRHQMSLYGQGTKPLWDTEGGWGRNATLTNPDQQSAYLAKYYILQASKGVARFYWYAWDSGDWGTLWDQTTGIHKPGLAYSQVYKWLAGATISRRCTSDSKGTWSCTLSRPGGYEGLIIWNSASTITYLPPPQYNQYRNLYGYKGLINGIQYFKVGTKPILFETNSP